MHQNLQNMDKKQIGTPILGFEPEPVGMDAETVKSVLAPDSENQLPAPEGFEGKGKWIDTPEISEGHKVYELNVAEMDFNALDPQPGKEIFCKDGHLYCGADSPQSANEIFANMLKALVLQNSQVKKREKKKASRIIQMAKRPIYCPGGKSKFF